MRHIFLLTLAAGLFMLSVRSTIAADTTACISGTGTGTATAWSAACATCSSAGGMLRDAAGVARECARVSVQAVKTAVRGVAAFLSNFYHHVQTAARKVRAVAQQAAVLLRQITDWITTEGHFPSLNHLRSASSSFSVPAPDHLRF